GSLNFVLKLGTTTVYISIARLSRHTNVSRDGSSALCSSGLVVGTYTWSVSYAGDGNNNGAVDQGGAAEQTVVSPANPTIVTTAKIGRASCRERVQTTDDAAAVKSDYHGSSSLS